jgi:hypothetical protein
LTDPKHSRGWIATVQPLLLFWGLAPSPNPGAKGFASGLLHSLALASTLPRPFRWAERKVFTSHARRNHLTTTQRRDYGHQNGHQMS